MIVFFTVEIDFITPFNVYYTLSILVNFDFLGELFPRNLVLKYSSSKKAFGFPPNANTESDKFLCGLSYK